MLTCVSAIASLGLIDLSLLIVYLPAVVNAWVMNLLVESLGIQASYILCTSDSDDLLKSTVNNKKVVAIHVMTE